ncbi:glycoside hydrolase family 43 protein [Schleiferilactobacillus harbinensis]|uniref:glycoside hydrolase family 43 protein n=1 Tax=Schleiferilactobacillus harbinensis TaxID=304207 RepID=UPI0021A5633F|nr:glycoside hydrolase 43 family protein [Schleiferilactobacillus harbinensis]
MTAAIQGHNPILYSDFPDPDIIYADGAYYLASTTMHFMPGAVILRSYDLIQWEIVGHVFNDFADTPAHQLLGATIYGQGMWAPSLRHHKGLFYLLFAANDTRHNYLFTAKNVQGPWTQHVLATSDFYHDPSLFFDDDDRVYVIYGNATIRLQELTADATQPKLGGLQRILIEETAPYNLGYEGSHFYKHAGRYYLFNIHAPKGPTFRRTQVCSIAKALTDDFETRTIVDADLGFHGSGIAQGGMVATPGDHFFGFFFQDRGAIGRVPMLTPMAFAADGFPVVNQGAEFPAAVSNASLRPDHRYVPLNQSDDFDYTPPTALKPCWEFNHHPQIAGWSVTAQPKTLRLTPQIVVTGLPWASNTLTQRTQGPCSAAQVTVDGARLVTGDFAGLALFQGEFGAIGLTRDTDGRLSIVMRARTSQTTDLSADSDFLSPGQVLATLPAASSTVTLLAVANFTDMADTCRFYYQEADQWHVLGPLHHLHFKMDHFTGARFGLFHYATERIGGQSDFHQFRYYQPDETAALIGQLPVI